jgi:hypothetical protein
MSLELHQELEGQVLGALAVRSPYDVAPSLSMLVANLARFNRDQEIRDEIMTVLDTFSSFGLVTLMGSLSQPTECRVALATKTRAAQDFFPLAEAFIKGGVVFHCASPVQVSRLRRAAYRLWPEKEVDSAIYPAARSVRTQRSLVCHDLAFEDVDQWYFALPRNSALLA